MKNKDKDKLKKSFDDSATYLLKLALSISEKHKSKKINPVDVFRIFCINRIVIDIAKMRDCLLDTYDVPWEIYKEDFKQKTKELAVKYGDITNDISDDILKIVFLKEPGEIDNDKKAKK